ncbi:MAG: hypothetical protein Pars92KO_33010 [Parasphingorhabdus sp.]
MKLAADVTVERLQRKDVHVGGEAQVVEGSDNPRHLQIINADPHLANGTRDQQGGAVVGPTVARALPGSRAKSWKTPFQ